MNPSAAKLFTDVPLARNNIVSPTPVHENCTGELTITLMESGSRTILYSKAVHTCILYKLSN